MPYKSDAQRRYFNANRRELESQGVDVDEWNQTSKGKRLPERVKKEEAVMDKQSQQAAIKKMAAYVRYLADKIPVGTKAAEVSSNQRRCGQLLKLANEIERSGNLVTAVATIYAGKSAAYRHKVVSSLVRGLSAKIAQAKQARSMQGVSSHPSASMNATTVSPVPGGTRTSGPLSTVQRM